MEKCIKRWFLLTLFVGVTNLFAPGTCEELVGVEGDLPKGWSLNPDGFGGSSAPAGRDLEGLMCYSEHYLDEEWQQRRDADREDIKKLEAAVKAAKDEQERKKQALLDGKSSDCTRTRSLPSYLSSDPRG